MGTVVKCNRWRSSMMQIYSRVIVGLFLIVPLVLASENEQLERNEKLISTFQIVRFPNEVCVGSSSRNGTCYTSAECSDKGGTSAGSCADGFGVCCTFTITTCDQSTSENLTYWTNPSSLSDTTIPIGPVSCGLTVCPATADQMGSTLATNCMTDTFHAQGASPSSSPPVVCGTLTGSHMYVEADTDRCNMLSFSFADKANTALADINTRGTIAFGARTWDITVTQIECTSVMLPPPGCTQYFASPSAKFLITSYNWQSGAGIQLGQQHQRICIRRERGNCRGCFAAADALFKISGNIAIATTYSLPGACCGYYTTLGPFVTAEEEIFYGGLGYGDTAGENVWGGFDCVIIPGAQGPAEADLGTVEAAQTATKMSASILSVANDSPMSWPPQICGNSRGLGIGCEDLQECAMMGTAIAAGQDIGAIYTTAINSTVCTKNAHFMLEFLSDDLEGMGGEAGMEYSDPDNGAEGFQILSTQLAC